MYCFRCNVTLVLLCHPSFTAHLSQLCFLPCPQQKHPRAHACRGIIIPIPRCSPGPTKASTMAICPGNFFSKLPVRYQEPATPDPATHLEIRLGCVVPRSYPWKRGACPSFWSPLPPDDQTDVDTAPTPNGYPQWLTSVLHLRSSRNAGLNTRSKTINQSNQSINEK